VSQAAFNWVLSIVQSLGQDELLPNFVKAAKHKAKQKRNYQFNK
jgi:hypothetical protein